MARRTFLVFLALGLLASGRPVAAVPRARVVDFDVNGDGITSPALQLLGVATEWDGGFRLAQPIALEADRSYCVGFDVAVENIAADRPSRYRLEIDVGPEHRSVLLPIVDIGTVHRSRVEFVVHPEEAGPLEFRVDLHHDVGPVDDPAIYFDAIRVVPVDGPKLIDSFTQQHWMGGLSVLGWQHDFRAQGIGMGVEIGIATVELVVWDDAPTDPRDGLEVFELWVNGVVVPGFDLDGSMENPHRIIVHFPWLECNDAFGGIVDVRLASVPAFNAQAGDFYFGAAHMTVVAGPTGASLLRNGDFDSGLDAWTCDAPECLTTVERASWTRIKILYR